MDTKRRNAALLAGSVIVVTTGGILWYRSIYLSRDFKKSALTKSVTATKLGITEQFNPPRDVIKRGRRFAKKVLQPVRNQMGVAVFTDSWWRHPKTNTAVGGVIDSAHLTAEAADLRTVVNGRFRNDLLANAVLDSGVPFTKMILEHGTLNRPLWIHLRFTPGRDEKKILRIEKNGYTYNLSRADIRMLS